MKSPRECEGTNFYILKIWGHKWIFYIRNTGATPNFMYHPNSKKRNTWKSWTSTKTSPNLNCNSKYPTKKNNAKNINHLRVNTTLIKDLPRTIRYSINMISEATTANFSPSKSFCTACSPEWIQVTLHYIKTLPIILSLWRNKVVKCGIAIFAEI